MRAPPDPELSAWRLTPQRVVWLGAATLMTVAPHALRIPLWIPALVLALCAWRGVRVYRGETRPPDRWLIAAIGLAMLPGIYLSYGTLTGRHAGVALLTVLAATKLLETRSLRDGYVLCYLGFFILATSFLFSQSLLLAAYSLPAVIALIATMGCLSVESPAAQTPRQLARAAALVAQAVPLMLVLFLLFPRIPGPLWGLPHDAHSAMTGLSEDMRPGDISRLSQSDAVAFRVQFDGATPPPDQRYWRATVLTVSDGRRWSAAIQRARRKPDGSAQLAADAEILRYQVTLEPGAGFMLPALDYALDVPPGAVLTDSHSLRMRRRLSERHRYRLRSAPEARLTSGLTARVQSLELPPRAHPRARALARAWRERSAGPQQIVEQALALFARGGFSYTLTPPLLEGDPVDEFLFQTRQGFCEHYAAAFTVLMRAAGIPARVVAGYQGGETSPLADYMVVRQRDAHAWAEVWLPQRGWVRVDPTAQVAPQRISGGLDAAIAPIIGPRALGITAGETATDVLRALRNTLDVVQARWNLWVLAYGPDRQRRVLSQAGLGEDLGDFALLSVAAVAMLMALLAVWVLRKRSARDPVREQYQRFCAKLARRGLARNAHEGPYDYARRVCHARPELSAAVNAITTRYVQLRYADSCDDVSGFRKRVRAFKA